ncbi:hypothetical protein PENSPDRAFT_651207 [Peniophora sp. CONT]|nr:hypothetical protein PENSPDRAFT_651207 [Peniophora sp. CONT]
MSQFPLELWSQIIPLACMDGGATARALSATCHYLRSASLPYKHHFLKAGPTDKQFVSLARIVQGLRIEELPRVLALEATPTCVFDTGAGVQKLCNVDQASGDWDETVTNHLERILRRVHAVIEVLHLDVFTTNYANYKALYEFSFTNLREITLGGLHPFRPTDWFDYVDQCEFPALELFRITVDSVNGLTLCVPIQTPRLREVHILRSKPQHGLWTSMSMLFQLHPGAHFVVHVVPPSPLSIGYVHSLAQYKSNLQECRENVKVAGKENCLDLVETAPAMYEGEISHLYHLPSIPTPRL